MLELREIHRKIDKLQDHQTNLYKMVSKLVGRIDATLPTLVTEAKLNDKLVEQKERCKKSSRWNLVAKTVISISALVGAIYAAIQVWGRLQP